MKGVVEEEGEEEEERASEKEKKAAGERRKAKRWELKKYYLRGSPVTMSTTVY